MTVIQDKWKYKRLTEMSMLRFRYLRKNSDVFENVNLKGNYLLDGIHILKDIRLPKITTKETGFCTSKSLAAWNPIVLAKLPFARMPSRHYCLKLNTLHRWNWSPKAVYYNQWQSQMWSPKFYMDAGRAEVGCLFLVLSCWEPTHLGLAPHL